MTAWVSRRDPRGRTTFVSYPANHIELLVPPGAAEPAYDELVGHGLWWFGRWPRSEDVLIDFDPPAEARRVTTAVVVELIDDEFYDDVEAIMRQQLEDAWMLCQPAPGQPPDDRRTLRHAALLTSLHEEIRTAFPTEDPWGVEIDALLCTTDACDQLLMVPHHSVSMVPPPAQPEIRVLVIVIALVKTVWARARGQSVIGTVYVEHRASEPVAKAAHTVRAPYEAPPPSRGTTANPLL
jgi:hypothetical protein